MLHPFQLIPGGLSVSPQIPKVDPPDTAEPMNSALDGACERLPDEPYNDLQYSVFSYGSNSIYQLRGRVDNNNLQSYPAFLEGYKRIFCKCSEKWNGGVASIISKKYIRTYGIIVDLTSEELSKLDKYEIGYSKINVECTIIENMNNNNNTFKKKNCITYQANDHEWIEPPSQEYLVSIKVMLDEHDLYKKYAPYIIISKYNPLLNKLENLQKWKYPNREKLKLESFFVIVNSMKEKSWKMPHDLNKIMLKLNEKNINSIHNLELFFKENNNNKLLYFKLSTIEIIKKLLGFI
jgi:cation transport regulator ChaC